MAVLGVFSYALEVPRLEDGIKFYVEAGLQVSASGDRAEFFCPGQDHASIVLLGGMPSKRLHHITLRANHLEALASSVCEHQGTVISAPAGFSAEGLWVTDPHGMLIHLVDCVEDAATAPLAPFQINGPGTLVRMGRSGMRPQSDYPDVKPLRLGHVLLFTPDVMTSVGFMCNALGMGLADRAQEIIAFCCAKKHSDHHVVAFAKSPAIGFHHGSFQVRDPDEVGRGGRALVTKAGKGDWGFGRHTIGSNFFHYIQDPWGSWFEYYSDMDYIDDYESWTPTNYGMQDSLANWGPAVPADFVHNYEVMGTGSRR